VGVFDGGLNRPLFGSHIIILVFYSKNKHTFVTRITHT